MRFDISGNGIHPKIISSSGESRHYYPRGVSATFTDDNFIGCNSYGATSVWSTFGSLLSDVSPVGGCVKLQAGTYAQTATWSGLNSALTSGDYSFSCLFRLNESHSEGTRQTVFNVNGVGISVDSDNRFYFEGASSEDIDFSPRIGKWTVLTVSVSGGIVSIYSNGAKGHSFSGAAGTATGFINIGGDPSNNLVNVSVAGLYINDVSCSQDWAVESFRRLWRRDGGSIAVTKVTIQPEGGELRDITNLEGECWLKSGKIREGVDQDVHLADLELFKFADLKTLSPYVGGSDPNNPFRKSTSESPAEIILQPRAEVKIYFAKVSSWASDDYIMNMSTSDMSMRFSGYITNVDYSGDTVQVSCSDKGGYLSGAIITGFENSDSSALVYPRYGTHVLDENGNVIFDPDDPADQANAITHQMAIEQLLKDHDDTEETSIPTLLQSVDGVSTRPAITGSYSSADSQLFVNISGDEAYFRRRQFENQTILEAVNSIAAEAGRKVAYVWNEVEDDFVLTYYEPERDIVHPFAIIDNESIGQIKKSEWSIEDMRNDVRVVFKSTIDVKTGGSRPSDYPSVVNSQYDWEYFTYFDAGDPDSEGLTYIRASDSSSITSYGRSFMQIGEDLTSGITRQPDAEALVVAALKDLSSATVTYNVNVDESFEFEIDDYLQVLPDVVSSSSEFDLAVKSLTINFSAKGVKQDLEMVGKPSAGNLVFLRAEVLPGMVTQPLTLNPTEINFEDDFNIGTQLVLDQFDFSINQNVLNIATLQGDITTLTSTTVNLQNEIDLGVITDATLSGNGKSSDLSVEISADAGNQLTVGTDGALLVPSNGAVTVSTSASISGDGSGGSPLALFLSTDGGNIAALGTDGGLLVPTSPSATVSSDATIYGDGSAGDPLGVDLSADSGNILSIGTDSKLHAEVLTDASIDGDGKLGTELGVSLSADAGNVLTFGTDSKLMYNGEVEIGVNTGLDGLGTSASPLNVLISGDANNSISFGGDGGIFSEQVTQDSISDDDNDTKWEAERTADDDTLRAVVGGTDTITITDSAISIVTGSAVSNHAKIETSVGTATITASNGGTTYSILSASASSIIMLSQSPLGLSLVTASADGLNTGSKTIKSTAYGSLTDSTTTDSCLTMDGTEIVYREIALTKMIRGIQTWEMTTLFGGGVRFKLDKDASPTDFLISQNLGLAIADTIVDEDDQTILWPRERLVRFGGNRQIKSYPAKKYYISQDHGNVTPSTNEQNSDEVLFHEIDTTKSYSLNTLTLADRGTWQKVVNSSQSTKNLTVEGVELSPGTFSEFQWDGDQWISQAGIGGGGGGPYTVTVDSPTPGDVTVTDASSGNSFTIDESSFTQGNASLQSQITTNAGNISTNSSSISTNTANISSNDSDISALQSEDANLQAQIDAIIASGGGAGPYTVEQNTPTPGDVRVTDTASGNTFVIPESAFEYGHSALQSQITTNAGNISTNATNINGNATNISTNTSSIATNTSSISANTANISTNASNIASVTSTASSNQTAIARLEDARETRVLVETSEAIGTGHHWSIEASSGSSITTQYPFLTEVYDTESDMTAQFAEDGPSDSSGGCYFTAPTDGYYKYSVSMFIPCAGLHKASRASGTTLSPSDQLAYRNLASLLVKDGTFTKVLNPNYTAPGKTVYDTYTWNIFTGSVVDSRYMTPEISIYEDPVNIAQVNYSSSSKMSGEIWLNAGEKLSVCVSLNASASPSGGLNQQSDYMVIGWDSDDWDMLYGNRFEITRVYKTP